METTNLLVVKRDGNRQAYSREKLTNGLIRSCEKRPVSREKIDKAVDRIEERIKAHKGKELSSKKIGEIVMREIKKLDKVAYIRFASVYLDFKDPEDFEEATKKLVRKKK